MINNHEQQTENRFKCDMAHYFKAGMGKCIRFFDSEFVLFTFSLMFLFFSLLWIHTMVFYNGLVSFNKYGEGYPEAVMFAIMGIYGLWIATKKKNKVVIYDPWI